MEEMPPHALPGEHHEERSRQFKGIRFRKWGSWVAEIRLPISRQKLWLGPYTTAEQAARAFDAAVYCLRGPNAVFNILDSLPSIPSASSLSRHQIQLAAAKHATLEQPPPISPSAHSNDANANANKKKRKKARKDAALPSSSASVQETVLSLRESGNQQEQELVMWESLLAESVDCLTWNSERLPSSWEEQEQQYEQHEYEDISKFTDLWNFDDVQETVLSLSDSRHHQQEQELAMWDSLLAESGDCLTWNSERLPSIWEEEEQHHEEDISNFDNFTDLWNFDDVWIASGAHTEYR